MNKTTMTRAALREAIALKRNEDIVPIELPKGYETRLVATKDADRLLDYLNSMDAALPLLRELENYEITGYEYGKMFNGCRRLLRFMCGSTWHDLPWKVGKEAEAVSCAWWQFMTGEVVELVEESQA